MKNLVLGFAVIVFTIHTSAQDAVNDVFDQFAGKEGFTTVNITGEMLNMMVEMDKCHGRQDNLSTKINEIKILVQEEGSGVNFHELIYDQINRNEYKELMTVKESNESVNMLAKELNGTITEFLLIVSGDENVLISIKGNILLDELGNLAESINMEGLDILKMLDGHQ